jgi:thiol-disulfide isomerase/thioredoxin
MVMFYANWCVHCKEFAPQFDYIGYLAIQQKLPFAFAKIEASDSAKVKAKYDIGAYPTLKIFINGTHITYKKEQTAEAIFEYCMYKYKNKVINLKTKQEVEKVKAERDLRVKNNHF